MVGSFNCILFLSSCPCLVFLGRLNVGPSARHMIVPASSNLVLGGSVCALSACWVRFPFFVLFLAFFHILLFQRSTLYVCVFFSNLRSLCFFVYVNNSMAVISLVICHGITQVVCTVVFRTDWSGMIPPCAQFRTYLLVFYHRDAFLLQAVLPLTDRHDFMEAI